MTGWPLACLIGLHACAVSMGNRNPLAVAIVLGSQGNEMVLEARTNIALHAWKKHTCLIQLSSAEETCTMRVGHPLRDATHC